MSLLDAPTTEQVLERFRRFYDEFSPAWIARLEELYAPGFAFKDPFHAVNGDFAVLRRYFERDHASDVRCRHRQVRRGRRKDHRDVSDRPQAARRGA